jgi:hypothetical protein
VLALGNQETLFLQPADDLRSGRRRANALGLLEAFPQNLIVNIGKRLTAFMGNTSSLVSRCDKITTPKRNLISSNFAFILPWFRPARLSDFSLSGRQHVFS